MERIYLSNEIRRRVRERANGQCEYCRALASHSNGPFVIEHIIPLARGGTNELNNLAFACHGCNSSKYVAMTAFDLVIQEEVSLFHPRQHNWYEHFIWNEDFSRILGITPIGRATITRLELNREVVVNLRRALTIAGIHPPTQSEGILPNS